MLNLKKNCIGGLLALSIGTMALAAHADTVATPAQRTAPTPEMMAKFAQKMEKRQEALYAKLKLTAAQEPAWKTFIDQTKPPQRGTRMPHRDRDAWSKLTTPERMEKFLAGMQAREKFLVERLNVVKTFYAVLTPAQQKIFDAEYAHRHHRHHGMHDKRGATK